jgi:hypothetical protein
MTSLANVIGVGDKFTRSFDSLIRRCEVWLEDASYEFTDRVIAIIDLTKKLAHGRTGDFNVLENMEGTEGHRGALWEAFGIFDNSIQRILAKFLNENNYLMAISEMNNLSINLIHSINMMMNGQFPDERHNTSRRVKPTMELLDLFKAQFKDNEIYTKSSM